MFTPTFQDWPAGHRRLLQITVLLLGGILIYAIAISRVTHHKFTDHQQKVEEKTKKYKKFKFPLNKKALQEHYDECHKALMGDKTVKDSHGLIDISDATLKRATSIFKEDIDKAYPMIPGSQNSSMDLFFKNSRRLDYKDFFDRTCSEFKENGITLSPKMFGLEDDNAEPVFQLMLKLWTARRIIQAAINHKLKIMDFTRENASHIRPLRITSYTNKLVISSDKNSTKGERDDDTPLPPYLLEIPVSAKLSGSMEDFIAFVEYLNDSHLPLKNLVITSQPPVKLELGTPLPLNTLHFNIICSAFFLLPDNSATSRKQSL